MSTLKNNRWNLDEIDKMILEDGLRIKAAYFYKDMDLMIILLNNKKVIKRNLSEFKRLNNTSEELLNNYEISRTGIHWSKLDEDLSLRGFIKHEMLKSIQEESTVA
ncbi:MAG: DUF2442 domain-containing protein [Bacteroidota bacterium]